METQIQIDIFHYHSPDEILRDYISLRKKENPYFSIRSWAKSLNFNSHSQLHQIAHGKKLIPKKYIAAFCKSLQLNKEEADYFSLLIDIQRASSLEERAFYIDKLKEFNQYQEEGFEEVKAFQIVSDPLHFFILEIVSLKNAVYDIDFIKEKLHFKASSFDIRKALRNLVESKLIIQQKEGRYLRSSRRFYTKNDIPSDAIKNYHKNIASLIPDVLDNQLVQEREFNGTTFNIKKECLAEAKEEIRKFREDFVNKFSVGEFTGDQTYHFNMNFFAIIK